MLVRRQPAHRQPTALRQPHQVCLTSTVSPAASQRIPVDSLLPGKR